MKGPMMKFSVLKRPFSLALAHVIGAVDKRSTYPVLSHVLVTLSADGVSLSATDFEVRVTRGVAAESQSGTGSVCLPADILKGIVDNAPEMQLHFTLGDNGTVSIISGSFVSSVVCLPGDEFPGRDHTVSSGAVRLGADLLPAMLRTVEHACAQPTSGKGHLQGVNLVQEGGKFTAVATDGHRLSLAGLDLDLESLAFDRGVIVSTKASRVLKPITAGLNVDFSDNQAHFDSGRVIVSARLFEESFPDFRRVVPVNLTSKIVIDSALLIAAIEACGVVAEDEGKSVLLGIASEQVTVSALGPCGSVSAIVPCSGDQDLEIRFNSRYLLQALKALNCEVFLTFSDNRTAVLLIPVDHGQWDERLELIMPMMA